MNKHRYATTLLSAAILIFALLLSSCAPRVPLSGNTVEHQSTRSAIPVHSVLELSFRQRHTYQNPFFDARVEVDFIAPDGRKLARKGFYHSGDLWAVRFLPDQVGEWHYRYRFLVG